MILMIVLAVLGGWLLASVVLALVIGRAIRIADANRARAVATRSPLPQARSSARSSVGIGS